MMADDDDDDDDVNEVNTVDARRDYDKALGALNESLRYAAAAGFWLEPKRYSLAPNQNAIVRFQSKTQRFSWPPKHHGIHPPLPPQIRHHVADSCRGKEERRAGEEDTAGGGGAWGGLWRVWCVR